jgi:hypothetical protein
MFQTPLHEQAIPARFPHARLEYTSPAGAIAFSKRFDAHTLQSSVAHLETCQNRFPPAFRIARIAHSSPTPLNQLVNTKAAVE